MNREEVLAVCQRQLDAWNAHDPDKVASLFAEDATLHDAGGETASGRAAVAARARRYMDAFPDMRLEMISIEVDGNRYALEWKAAGTNTGSLEGMPATGKYAEVEGCDIGEMDDNGLIRSENDYWNEAAFMRQLGLMPEPVATA
jgi:steroid delta-isomerase-like uncharacterized protein